MKIEISEETYNKIKDLKITEEDSYLTDFTKNAYNEAIRKVVELLEEDQQQTPSLKPEEGDIFDYIQYDGGVGRKAWQGDLCDEAIYKIGNYFIPEKGKEDKAEQKVEELKAIQRVKEYIVKEFGYHPEKWADWEDLHQKKCYLYWEGLRSEPRVEWWQSGITKSYSPIGYLKTYDQAKQLIEDKQEDLEIIYKPK